MLLISAIFFIFTANNFWPFIFAIAFKYIMIYLENLSPENGLLIEYDNQNKNEQFCDWKRQYPKWSFVSDWTRLLSKNAKKEAEIWLNTTTIQKRKSILIGQTHTFELKVPLTTK